jgi:predicted TIM-barrel fold metal-dependent hydrolase
MLDAHVHIGQFQEEYYCFDKIFDIIFNSGVVDSIVYSSTSSCICDVKYDLIRNEISEALKKYPVDVAMPLFWVVPDYINQGITVETAMSELDYSGFKLHPYGNMWDFENDTKQYKMLHEVFDYADKRRMRVLIHTGESGVDRPNRFERFFGEYKNANIVLAHCRPAGEMIKVMQRYPNVSGDTAFANKERIGDVKNAGFGERLILGTDFPITHYFYGRGSGVSLVEQYKNDLEGLQELWWKEVDP